MLTIVALANAIVTDAIVADARVAVVQFFNKTHKTHTRNLNPLIFMPYLI